MIAAFLAFFAAWAAAAPAPEQKGLPIQRRDACVNPATFDTFLAAGADSWGVPESKAKQAVELLEAAMQCRAWTQGSPEPCRALALVPRFQAGKALAANCRSEHFLLAFYVAHARKDAAGAARACAGWYETNKEQMLDKVSGEALCGRLSELLAADPAAACAKLGAEMKDPAVAPVCAAVWTPDARSCAKADGLPFEKRRCADYAALRKALASGKAADCPKGPRYLGLCRALLEKEPTQACDAVRRSWQELLCAGRFQE